MAHTPLAGTFPVLDRSSAPRPNTEFYGSTSIIDQQICAAPCVLLTLWGLNVSGSDVFVQLFDATAQPIANDVPDFPAFAYPAGLNSACSGEYAFRKGLWIGVSSTPEKYTAVGAAAYQFHAVLER